MRAVLLAAGEGKRLRPYFNRPKPLVRLLGLSLIERNILTLRECGIEEFIVITGCYAEEIREYLGDGSRFGVKIKYLHNPDWQLGNGLSAYTFQQEYRPNEKFLLLMADHIFELALVKQFICKAESVKENELLLAADNRLAKVFDLDECTKVKYQQDHIIKCGKGLAEFNAVDCGLFIGTGSLLEALSQTIAKGAYALANAVNHLAEAGKVKVHFVQHSWIDVDDYPSYKQAEKILLKSLVPLKDGFISRAINRRLSLRITKFLSTMPVTPNQITFLSFLTATAAAVSFAVGEPFVGGIMAQLASVLDGVDGEIARLKYLRSSFGEVFDSVLDRYADCFIVMGMVASWYNTTGHYMALAVGGVALAGMPMSMLFKEKFRSVFKQQFIPEIHDGLLRYIPANRDGRLFIVMLGGIFNQLPATLVLLAVSTHLQTFGRLYNVRKTYIQEVYNKQTGVNKQGLLACG